jgi:hypothetical protein
VAGEPPTAPPGTTRAYTDTGCWCWTRPA